MAGLAFVAASQFPYGAAATVGITFGLVGYLFGKKLVNAPNDNLEYLLFGAGYVSETSKQNAIADKVDEGNATLLETIGHLADELGKTVPQPSVDPVTGKLYYMFEGKRYTPEQLYHTLVSLHGVPTHNNDLPQDADESGLRDKLGGSRPDAATPGDTTTIWQDATQVVPYYPTAQVDAAGNPRQGNNTTGLTLYDQEFVKAHAALFTQVYGTKELAHTDVQQIFVVMNNAVRPDKRGDESVASWVNITKWINLKSDDARNAYEADLQKRAKAFADRVGRGDPIAVAPRPPAPSRNPSSALPSTVAWITSNTPPAGPPPPVPTPPPPPPPGPPATVPGASLPGLLAWLQQQK